MKINFFKNFEPQQPARRTSRRRNAGADWSIMDIVEDDGFVYCMAFYCAFSVDYIIKGTSHNAEGVRTCCSLEIIL